MRKIILVTILLSSANLFAQQVDDVDQLSMERNKILQMIDSLEQRLNEIDALLTKVSPEDKLEAMISKYGKNKGKLIANGKVWTSISPEMAIDSWGKPEKIQSSEVTSGTTQKWTYPNGRYLFFKNDRLESWRE